MSHKHEKHVKQCLKLRKCSTNDRIIACLPLQPSPASLLMTLDFSRGRAWKEWLGADVAYLLLFYLQTSMNVSNLGFVPRTARIPKEVMSVPVRKASGL